MGNDKVNRKIRLGTLLYTGKSYGRSGERSQLSQPPLCGFFSGDLSATTNRRLVISSKAPIHCRVLNRSPNQRWAKAMEMSNSLKPSRAVCIPPRCFTPKNKVRRERNVTRVRPIIGHQAVISAGRTPEPEKRNTGTTTALMRLKLPTFSSPKRRWDTSLTGIAGVGPTSAYGMPRTEVSTDMI